MNSKVHPISCRLQIQSSRIDINNIYFLCLKDSSNYQLHGKINIIFLSLIFFKLQSFPCAIFLELYLLRSWHFARPSGKPVLTSSFLDYYIRKFRNHCSSVRSWIHARILVSVYTSTYTFHIYQLITTCRLLIDLTLAQYLVPRLTA